MFMAAQSIDNRQKVEATEMSVDGWVIYAYNGRVFSLKKEGNSDNVLQRG